MQEPTNSELNVQKDKSRVSVQLRIQGAILVLPNLPSRLCFKIYHLGYLNDIHSIEVHTNEQKKLNG